VTPAAGSCANNARSSAKRARARRPCRRPRVVPSKRPHRLGGTRPHPCGRSSAPVHRSHPGVVLSYKGSDSQARSSRAPASAQVEAPLCMERATRRAREENAEEPPVADDAAPALERLADMGLEDLRLTRELDARFFQPWP
jgi:hypothetical protein